MASARIAIIGGGPGGLALARLLKLQNIPFRLFELDTSPESRLQGGSLDLHPNSGQMALKAAGLFSEFQKHSRPDGAALKMLNKDGTVVWADDGLGPEGSDIMPPDRPEIDRRDLRKMLLDSLDKGTIEWGKKVVKVEEEEECSTKDRPQFTVEFQDGAKECGFELIVGADGAWSHVRGLLTSEKPFYSGITNVEAHIEDIDRKHPNLAERVGRGTVCQMHGSSILMYQRNSDGSIRTYAMSRVEEDWGHTSGINWADTQESKQTLVDAKYSKWDALSKDFILQSDGPLILRPMYMLPIDIKWETRSGVTLIGDAAHLMTPFAGVGVNLALTDAFDLSQAIRAHIQDGIDWTTALRQFETKMLARAHVDANKTLSNLNNFFSGECVHTIVKRLGQVMVGGQGGVSDSYT